MGATEASDPKKTAHLAEILVALRLLQVAGMSDLVTPYSLPAELRGPFGAAPSRVDVRRWLGGSSLVRLEGRFPTGWTGHLTLGLARLGVSVQRGFAHSMGQGQWAAQLQVLPVTALADAATIDYVRLAAGGMPWEEPVPITLVSFQVQQHDPRGALRLAVRGWDRVGFLGSLLSRLAGLSLFPDAVRVETVGAMAVDTFYLRATGGVAPSEGARRALTTRLTPLQGLQKP